MKITDAFVAEHAVIAEQLDHLEKTMLSEVKTLADVKDPGTQLAATLDRHANLEEDLLFDALEAKMGDDQAVRKVRQDHARIEQLMQDVLGHLDNIQRLGHARSILLQAIKVARAHFNREEKETFPLAEEILGEEKLIQLGAQLEEE
jgi:hemerythrin-like domain-containing protein